MRGLVVLNIGLILLIGSLLVEWRLVAIVMAFLSGWILALSFFRVLFKDEITGEPNRE